MANLKLPFKKNDTYQTKQQSVEPLNKTNYLVSKIAKELQRSVENNNIMLKDNKLGFTELVYILVDMNYVSSNITESENKLLHFAWRLLRGDDNDGITIRNLLSFLLGINGLKLKDIIAETDEQRFNKTQINDNSQLLSPDSSYTIVAPQDKEFSKFENNEVSALSTINDKSNNSQIGVFLNNNEKFFFKSFEEQNKIMSIFRPFIVHKASSARCAYFIGTEVPPEDPSCPFKPEINSKSDMMAYNNFLGNKSIKQYSSNSSSAKSIIKPSHPEILLQKGKQYKNNVEKMKEQKIKEEMKQCTFVPKTNQGHKHASLFEGIMLNNGKFDF